MKFQLSKEKVTVIAASAMLLAVLVFVAGFLVGYQTDIPDFARQITKKVETIPSSTSVRVKIIGNQPDESNDKVADTNDVKKADADVIPPAPPDVDEDDRPADVLTDEKEAARTIRPSSFTCVINNVFLSEENAIAFSARLAKKGYESFVLEVGSSGNNNVYKVLAGEFDNDLSAEDLKLNLETSTGYLGSVCFVDSKYILWPVNKKKPEPPKPPKAKPSVKKPVASKPVPAKKTSKKKTSIITKSGMYPYSLRLGCYRVEEYAIKDFKKYNKKNVAPYMFMIDLGSDGGAWWRIYSGYYQAEENAILAKNKSKLSKSIVRNTPFAVLLNEYDLQNNAGGLAEHVSKLESEGFSPYVVKGTEKARLYLGVFTTKREAKIYMKSLEARGVAGKVALR